jgi:hypothetical protein
LFLFEVNIFASDAARNGLRYLLLKAKRMAATNVAFIAVRTVKKAA